MAPAFVFDNASFIPMHHDHRHPIRYVCGNYIGSLTPRGVWYGENPLKYSYSLTLIQIILAFIAASLIHFVLKPLKPSKLVCYIMGGIILGPSGMGRSETYLRYFYPPKQIQLLNTLGTLGVIYSMFFIGLKTDMCHLVKTTLKSSKARAIGSASFLSSFLAMLVIILPLLKQIPEFNTRNLFPSFFPAYASISNFPVISQALLELNLIASDVGQLAMTSSMVNDMIQYCIIAFGVYFRQDSSSHSFGALASFLALILFCIFVLRPAVLYINRTTPEGRPVKELYVVIMQLTVALLAVLCDFVGVAYILGPLLFGLLIPSGPPVGSTLLDKTELVVSVFLLPLFYVLLGYNTDVSSITDWKAFGIFQSVILVGHLAKFLGTFAVSLACKIRMKQAIMLGLIMNIEGIFELVVNFRWRSQEFISQQYYTQLILTMVLVTAIVTPLIENLHDPDEQSVKRGHLEPMKTIQTTPANSELRVLCCIYHEENVHRMIVLLEACNPTRVSPLNVYAVQLLEVKARADAALIPYKRWKRKSKSSDDAKSHHIFQAFENYSENSNGAVKIKPYINNIPFKIMHENICSLVRDNHIPFIIIPFHENERHLYGDQMAASIHCTNSNIQAHAPCTVGILINRGFQTYLSITDFSYSIVLLFFGGPDDREALALAGRMSGNPNVSISLLRFVLRKQKPHRTNSENKNRDNDSGRNLEKILDNSLLREFKRKNAGNASVVCREVVVKDFKQLVKQIQNMESNHDLLMVGKRHEVRAFGKEDESHVVEIEELGIIGSMLASKDFTNGKGCVLVTQYFGDDSNGYLNDTELDTCPVYV